MAQNNGDYNLQCRCAAIQSWFQRKLPFCRFYCPVDSMFRCIRTKNLVSKYDGVINGIGYIIEMLMSYLWAYHFNHPKNLLLKLTFSQYAAIHTNYIIFHC